MSAVLDSPPASPPAPPRRAAAQLSAQAVLACVPLVMRELRAAMRRAAPAGLTVPQFRALLFAHRQPDAGVGDLAQHLGVTLPTASVAVANLDKRGLLQVAVAAEDKRRKLIRLTPQGRALVEAAWQQTEHEFAQRLADVPGAKLAQIPGALEALTPGPVNTTARGAKRRIGAPI